MYEVPTSISIVDPFFAAPTTRAMKSPQAVMLHGEKKSSKAAPFKNFNLASGAVFVKALTRRLKKGQPDVRGPDVDLDRRPFLCCPDNAGNEVAPGRHAASTT
jgi:hypothetical protein